MSAFHGPQAHQSLYARGRNKGAKAALRALKRAEAAERLAETPPERRSKKRRRS